MDAEAHEIEADGVTHVRIGELRTATRGILKATLGSCVGIALINRRTRMCGLAHCFLPFDPAGLPSTNARYANTAAVNLLQKVAPEEADRRKVRAYLTGGGRLMARQADAKPQVGDLNLEYARASLRKLGIRFTEIGVGEGGACNGILDCNALTFASVRLGPQTMDEDVVGKGLMSEFG